MEEDQDETQEPLPSSIKFVRMVTGEDLLTEITEVEPEEESAESYYVFHKPLKIIYSAGKTPGVLAVHFMQWVFSHVCPDQTFVVYPHEVLTIGNPNTNLVGYYFSTVEYFNQKDKELIELNDDIPDQDVPDEVKEQIKSLFSKISSGNDKKKLH